MKHSQVLGIVLCYVLGVVNVLSAAESKAAGGKVYATAWFGGEVGVVDLNTGKTTRTVKVGIHDHNIF